MQIPVRFWTGYEGGPAEVSPSYSPQLKIEMWGKDMGAKRKNVNET